MTKKLTKIATLMLLLGLFAVCARGADGDEGWITLFDGKDLSAWDNGAGGAPEQLPERARMLQQWADLLDRPGQGGERTVVPGRFGKAAA